MIRLAKLSDVSALQKLSEQAFGKNFHDQDYFSENNLKECTVFDDGEIQGYCMSHITQRGIKIDSIVVNKNARGKGIATALIEDVIVNFPHKTIFTHAWKRGQNVALAPILERLGFVNKEELLKPWYNESLESGFICPECGHPCICSAIVYEK